MGPQDRFGPQKDLKIVSKWTLLDEKSEQYVSSSPCGVEPRNQSKSGRRKKMARVPSMQIAFFVAKWPHSTQRAREVSWKNWREFRLCTRLFFLTHRLHSTQQTRKLCQKIGEHSVHAHDCFPQCIGHTVHSEQREGSAAWR